MDFLTEKKISTKKCSWGLKTPKIIFIFFLGGGAKNFIFSPTKIFFPGVLKKNFGGGGGILGCLGRPTPPPGGRAGSENDTLLPMAMTCDRLNSGAVRLGGQKLSSGNRKPFPARSRECLIILTSPSRRTRQCTYKYIWNIYIDNNSNITLKTNTTMYLQIYIEHLYR